MAVITTAPDTNDSATLHARTVFINNVKCPAKAPLKVTSRIHMISLAKYPI